MKIKALLFGAAMAPFAAGIASADVISALGSDGALYNIDVSTLSANILRYVPDPPTIANQDNFSPNALGVSDDGGIVTNMTFATSGDEEIYVNGIAQGASVSTETFAVAAGDTENGTYYYVDGNLELYSVASNGTGAISLVGDLGPTAPLGDLAIMGNTGFLSFGSSFGIFDLTDVASGFTSLFNLQRFVGLGVAGSNLYGIGATGLLSKWNGQTDGTFAFLELGTVTGLNTGTQFTDASSAVVPLPAAGWMLLAGIGGLAAMKRRRQKM
jgi:hypothetical protein